MTHVIGMEDLERALAARRGSGSWRVLVSGMDAVAGGWRCEVIGADGARQANRYIPIPHVYSVRPAVGPTGEACIELVVKGDSLTAQAWGTEA